MTKPTKKTVVKAYKSAGFWYDEINSHKGYYNFYGSLGEHYTFTTWKDASQWLYGVILE